MPRNMPRKAVARVEYELSTTYNDEDDEPRSLSDEDQRELVELRPGLDWTAFISCSV